MAFRTVPPFASASLAGIAVVTIACAQLGVGSSEPAKALPVTEQRSECIRDYRDHSLDLFRQDVGGTAGGGVAISDIEWVGDLDADGHRDVLVFMETADGRRDPYRLGNQTAYFYLSRNGCPTFAGGADIERFELLAATDDRPSAVRVWRNFTRNGECDQVAGFIYEFVWDGQRLQQQEVQCPCGHLDQQSPPLCAEAGYQ